jgi:hypothetical protein
MKNIVFAATAALLMSTAAHAADMTFPSDDPVATITIPDDWGPKETDSGIDATSPDDAVYLSIDVADAKDTDATVQAAVKYLADQGVTVDDKSAKQTQNTLNGMPFFAVDWTGNDKDGPVSIGLAAVTVAADKNLVFTYWGTKGDEDKDQAKITEIMRSLKPAGK